MDYKFKYYNFNSDSDKIYLGDSRNKKCRFCNRHEPDVKFRTIAHAIPEMLGNKFLISNYECDECNQKFGKLENDLGIFLGPIRAIYSIPGKRKRSSKYKTQWFNIINNENNIIFEDICNEYGKNNRNANFNFKDRTLDFHIERKGYIPINIYKSFVKMALSLIPEDTLQRLEVYLKFLNGELDYMPKCEIREIFIPGMNYNQPLSVIIAVNNGSNIYYDGSTLPLVIFSLRIKGFEYQLNLYEDVCFCKKYVNVKINPILNLYQRFTKVSCSEKIYPFNSKTKAKDQLDISFSFDKMEDITEKMKDIKKY